MSDKPVETDAQVDDQPDAKSAGGVRLSIRIRANAMREIEAFIQQHDEPKPNVFEAVRELLAAGLDAHRRKRAAVKAAVAEARKGEYAKATADHLKAQIDENEKTQRLKQMRLAKEARDQRLAAAAAADKGAPAKKARAKKPDGAA